MERVGMPGPRGIPVLDEAVANLRERLRLANQERGEHIRIALLPLRHPR